MCENEHFKYIMKVHFFHLAMLVFTTHTNLFLIEPQVSSAKNTVTTTIKAPSPNHKNMSTYSIFRRDHYTAEQCWAVTSYCNLVTVIILLFAVTSSVTNY